MPIKCSDDSKIDARVQINDAIQQMKKDKVITIQYVDLNIQDEIFNNVSIMKGSKMTFSEEKQLLKIIDQFNPTANIQTSSLS